MQFILNPIFRGSTSAESLAPVRAINIHQFRSLFMNWIILIIAGFCETGFAFCLGKTKLAEGTEYWLWISGFALLYVMSAVLLAKATQTIPIGIAYPVWTGIGAVGAVLLGIFVFHEPATFWRLLFLSTLILSIVGLKIVG